jgi:hypothetical protein
MLVAGRLGVHKEKASRALKGAMIKLRTVKWEDYAELEMEGSQ